MGTKYAVASNANTANARGALIAKTALTAIVRNDKMKYKVEYEDCDHRKHVRYYAALNAATAREMFKATVDHSFGDKNVKITALYKLSKHWEPLPRYNK